MKIIYHLDIHSYKGNRRHWLSVCYSDKQKAITELKRWSDKFRKEWNVPEQSDSYWDLDEKFTDDMNIEFRYIGRDTTKENRYLFSGHVFENRLIEEGEEIIGLCGEVFASGDNPDILFTNSSPLMDNSTSFKGTEPINMAKKERCDFSLVAGGAVIQNEEKATEYYNLRERITDNRTYEVTGK